MKNHHQKSLHDDFIPKIIMSQILVMIFIDFLQADI